ncbi:MAG: prephenate dehydrogenase/arogenate dehydrogenase family protein [Candidatus Latescibacterota bacterium]|jgi:prephenate dehydrogenase
MTDPPFKNATIVLIGIGLIGGSLGLALKRLGIGRKIIGVSRAETLKEAQALGVIDAGFDYDALGDGVKDADLVFLCAPISRILEQLPQVMDAVPVGCVVSDVGSTKRALVQKAEACKRKDVYFVGGHPMAGSEKSGVGAADPFLFENALYVLTPAKDVPDASVDAMVKLIRCLGARPMHMDAETHDRVAAAVSHLPQMIATSLVNLVGRLNQADGLPLQMAAGGFRDLTRIASSPFSMWRDICQTNTGPIQTMLDAYIDELVALRDKVDHEALAENFAFANEIRNGIPKDSKGFLHPLHEVLMVAEDKPGVIADSSSRLANAGVNIEDIEVLKVREGEGGTIRMGFGKQADAEQAVSILSAAGYQVRLR